jgi:hypothetical protein
VPLIHNYGSLGLAVTCLFIMTCASIARTRLVLVTDFKIAPSILGLGVMFTMLLDSDTARVGPATMPLLRRARSSALPQ